VAERRFQDLQDKEDEKYSSVVYMTFTDSSTLAVRTIPFTVRVNTSIFLLSFVQYLY
jgi:hypothetical protein